ncbi:AraC family transcriptional regulator [Pseudoduganella albidiflava]|uniref:Transcriptional regulator n=1 Tax=Pseudoduganella albidiflava TaxID=321983 RepID=A0A411WZU5_9BURK|nr:AraC family transcriptional regulator [Pseudoduganella albidiflava]QBI02229.1 AraC family transcriptional regulator [Pseudoduganella albidiflava]GGY59512.1 transcriptional regulator [Pseudoduganella albidiflava]
MDSAADTDRLVHWLIDSIELEAAAFHVGQYCGRWRASTAGRGLGSYHLVLHGTCWLHVAGRAPLRLGPRDGVFLLRDIDHFISSDPDPAAPLPSGGMQPLHAAVPESTGLACGFFQFHGALSTLVVDSFPDVVELRADDASIRAAGTVFDLMLAEAQAEGQKGADPDLPPPLVSRLAGLLFFYVTRHVARRHDVLSGLLALARRPDFAMLLERMMADPGHDWSTDAMARAVHMSRSSFYKHFVDASGQPPAQFLLLLRMKIAAQRLHGGETIERAAEHVGYRSHAAFSRAFHRVIGEPPGAFRRQRRARDTAPQLN